MLVLPGGGSGMQHFLKLIRGTADWGLRQELHGSLEYKTSDSHRSERELRCFNDRDLYSRSEFNRAAMAIFKRITLIVLYSFTKTDIYWISRFCDTQCNFFL